MESTFDINRPNRNNNIPNTFVYDVSSFTLLFDI